MEATETYAKTEPARTGTVDTEDVVENIKTLFSTLNV